MAAGPKRELRPVGASAKPRKRTRKPAPPPDLADLLGGRRDGGQVPVVQHLQRAAGNRATADLLTAQRDPATDTATDTPQHTDPRAAIDTALGSPGDRALIAAIDNFAPATDTERLTMLTTLTLGGAMNALERRAAFRLWQSFSMGIAKAGSDNYALWQACNAAGAGLAPGLLGKSAGNVTTSVSEQVGGTTYGAHGAYSYLITGDKITITVPMTFVPDKGVAVPVSTWFGFIQSTWNKFSAVNADDPADVRRIEFQPVQGGGPSIQVVNGKGRANAGKYFLGDQHASDTVPHEFGHLVGLEDEYERDRPDYERVTTEAADAPDTTKAVPAAGVAKALHNALHAPESFFELHSSAVRRKMREVDAVLGRAGITPDRQFAESAYTHEVAQVYKDTYGIELAVDIQQCINLDADDVQNWREIVAGSFQYTNHSLMGDMKDHNHPVQPRHVQQFVNLVAQFRGGQWSAQPHS